MPGISFSNVSHGDQRLNVDLSRTTNDVVHLTPPSNFKAFGRVILNVILFGTYTRLRDNPKQWNAFRDALAAQYRPGLHGGINEDRFERVFEHYSTHEHLTRSKASNVLAELQAIRDGKWDLEEPRTDAINASQNLLARGLRTLSERHRDLRENEISLLDRASAPQVNQANARAVRDVLRPGRSIEASSIIRGQAALKIWDQNENRRDFEYTAAGLSFLPLDEVLNNVTAQGQEQIERLRDSAETLDASILSIPFGLRDTSPGPKEDHVVLIAADFKTKKVLYLDSKAIPLDLAHQRFGAQGNDFRGALSSFGQRLFGEEFDPQRDVLELAHPKQQGACDCGPFTHFFSKALLLGASPIEIDGAVGIEERSELRAALAMDILGAQLDDQLPPGSIDAWGTSGGRDEDVISLGADEEIPDNAAVGGGQPAGPELPAVNLDELTPRINVSNDSEGNIRQLFENTTTPVTVGRSVQTQNRVLLEETQESRAEWRTSMAPGTSIPQSILVESGPADLAKIDRLFEGGYLDRSSGVDTARSNFEIGGVRVDGDDLLDRVTVLANSHGITDETAVRRLYNSLDSQFPHSASTEFQALMNREGNYFTPKSDGPAAVDLTEVRFLDPVPGEPGSFILSADITRSANALSVGFNDSDEFRVRDFQIPGGGAFRYQGKIQAKITLTNDPGQPPVFKNQFCRSLLSVGTAVETA